VLPALLVLLAAYADSRGSHGVALDALLVAVPFAAIAALGGFAAYLEARDDAVVALQALLSGLVVGLLVLSCAARSSALEGVPPLATTCVVACLFLFAVKLVLAVAPYARRLAGLRVAKP
jgi:hypothetical protein